MVGPPTDHFNACLDLTKPTGVMVFGAQTHLGGARFQLWSVGGQTTEKGQTTEIVAVFFNQQKQAGSMRKTVPSHCPASWKKSFLP
jgi:hypothetical protein